MMNGVISNKSLDKLLALTLAVACCCPSASAEQDFFDLNLDDLARTDIATLTHTSARLTPAAVSTINQQQILNSGARSLNELLEQYVPGLQLISHNFGFSHLGLRGIMGDRDLKYLLQVNGVTLNQHTIAGAFTERDLALLADIDHIEIVRGAGSAVHGLGAVTMVINIHTINPGKEKEWQSRTRAGAVEKFLSQELSLQDELENGWRYFVYAGISDYQGADPSDALLHFSTSFETQQGDRVVAGEDVSLRVGNDGAQYRDKNAIKVHTSLSGDNWTAWGRYTRGGQEQAICTTNMAEPPLGRAVEGYPDDGSYPAVELGYQQLTIVGEMTQAINNNWNAEYQLSFDSTDYERNITLEPASYGGPRIESHREDEWLARAIAINDGNRTGQYAVGFEWSHEKFGKQSPGYPHEPATSSAGFEDGMPSWSTNRYSLLGEYQYHLQSPWVIYLNGRVDKHVYSDMLISPRAAAVYAPNSRDSYKVMLSRSQRTNDDATLKAAAQQGDKRTEPEVLDSLELRWEHIVGESVKQGVEQNSGQMFALSYFYIDLDVIGYVENGSLASYEKVGNQKQWGIDIEWRYQWQRWTLDSSHEYTRLTDFNLSSGAEQSLITNYPNGYGKNLNNWSSNLTKINLSCQLSTPWAIYSAVQVYWGFDGVKDYSDFLDSGLPPDQQLRDDDQHTIYDSSVYWNIGTRYQPNEQLT